jgi:hypothetical protein
MKAALMWNNGFPKMGVFMIDLYLYLSVIVL